MKRRAVLLMTAVATVVCAVVVAKPEPRGEDKAWGKPVDGLRLGISAPDHESHDKAVTAVWVTLANSGGQDRLLRLGHMLGNGAEQFTSAVRLVTTDQKGVEREMSYTRRAPGHVSGRLDPLVLPLPNSASLGIGLVLDKHYTDGSEMPHGTYQVRAVFDGKPVDKSETNLDVPGLAVMRYWVGSLESGLATVVIE